MHSSFSGTNVSVSYGLDFDNEWAEAAGLDLGNEWENFKTKHGKTYASQEEVNIHHSVLNGRFDTFQNIFLLAA